MMLVFSGSGRAGAGDVRVREVGGEVGSLGGRGGLRLLARRPRGAAGRGPFPLFHCQNNLPCCCLCVRLRATVSTDRRLTRRHAAGRGTEATTRT